MPFKKTLGKAYKGAKKFVKKRYGLNKKSKGLKYGQMASDVMMLKKAINAEKKSKTALFTGDFAQVNGNNTGALIFDVTPLIDQGAGQDQRNGASVKLTSALHQFQMSHMPNATVGTKVKIDFWLNKGQAQTTATALTQIFDIGTFSRVIDVNSPRNQDRFSDYRLLRSVTKYLPADPNVGDNPVITFDIPMQYNRGQGHHIRLVPSLSGTPVNDILNGQLFVTIRSSVGNASGTTVSTRDVATTAILTGQVCRYAYKQWYYDN